MRQKERVNHPGEICSSLRGGGSQTSPFCSATAISGEWLLAKMQPARTPLGHRVDLARENNVSAEAFATARFGSNPACLRSCGGRVEKVTSSEPEGAEPNVAQSPGRFRVIPDKLPHIFHAESAISGHPRVSLTFVSRGDRLFQSVLNRRGRP